MTEIHAGSLSDFTDATCRLVEAGGREVGIRSWAGELYAYENTCLHQGGPVCEGIIVGRVEELLGAGGESAGLRFRDEAPRLVCPWHGYEYDLRTGRLATDPSRGLRSYEVRCRDGEVYLVV